MYSFSSKLWFNKRAIASKTGEVSIYLQVVINRSHKEFPLKLKWPVNKIDLIKGLLLPRQRGDKDVDDYNLLLLSEQAKHIEILRSYRIRRAPIDMQKFIRELNTFDNKDSFIAFMLNHNRRRYDTKEIENRTYRNIRSTIMLMINFNLSWRYEMLTVKFLKQFKIYLQGKDYEPGHIWSKIRDVKSHLKMASTEPLIHVDPEVIAFSNPQPQWRTTYLNREEVNSLIKVYREEDLKAMDRNVLRAFLFTCFTSLRISDVYRVNADWRIDENFIDFIPKKNQKKRKRLKVPIMGMARMFIQNETGQYFDLPTEQEYNRTLKQMALKAGIKKRLTSHVGRHTFGYLFMTTVGNMKALQEILGHTNSKTTERYAHLDDEYKYLSVMQMQEGFNNLRL